MRFAVCATCSVTSWWRSGAGVEPTPRALALWPTVRDALRHLQHTLAPSDFNPATADTSFVLAMADATAAELIPGLVQIAEREAPGIAIRVVPLTTRDPRQLLESEGADMAVGYFPAVLASLTARGQSGAAVPFETQRLYVGQYVCVMRRGHPLADKPLTLDDYCAARHLLVSFSGRPYGFIDQTLGTLGRERRIVVTVNQFFTAGRVVANSDLLTVLPRHFVSVTGIDDELVLRDLPFDQPLVHVDAVWHRRAQHGHAHEWLRDALVRSAAVAFARSVIERKVPAA